MDRPRSFEPAESHALAGALLALGSALLFTGTLFYIGLTPRLGLPAPAPERMAALSDALVAAPRMARAGGFAFFGDILLTAAGIALVRRRRLAGSDLEAFGWTLIAVAAAIAIVFDSMMAVLLAPLAELPAAGTFLAFKSWFDFLFAAGDVPFGIGAIAVLWADMRSDTALLPKPLAVFGIGVGAVALASGLGYVTGTLILPPALGLTVTLGCVVFAVFGVQIIRYEGAGSPAGIAAGLRPAVATGRGS